MGGILAAPLLTGGYYPGYIRNSKTSIAKKPNKWVKNGKSTKINISQKKTWPTGL
jgi:hypothetical protein